MKKLLIFAAIISIIHSCDTVNLDNDLIKGNLRGNVKSVRETLYEAKIEAGDFKGWTQDDSKFFNTLSVYNRKGNIIEKYEYELDGSMDTKQTYSYSKKGTEIKERSYDNNGEKWNDITVKYELDNDDNILERTIYSDEGKVNARYRFVYDDQGNMIEERGFDYELNPTRFAAYQYDEEGNRTEEKSMLFEYDLYFHMELLHDTQGNIIEEKHYDRDGVFSRKYITKYVYDNRGNWLEKVRFKDDTPVQKYERIIEYF